MAVRGGQANSPSRRSSGGGRSTGGTANRGTQSSLQPGGGHTRARTDIAGRQLGQEMSESQIVGFLGRKIWQAMNDEDGDLSEVRQENFNYYIGQEYGSERDGYSKFVTREALETVEQVLPSVLRVFTSGDKVVVFDPATPEDEDQAAQETDIVNYYLMKANRGKGFLALHHWFKDALMFPNGYIKAYIKESLHTDVGRVTGVDEIGLQMLDEDPDVEILEQTSRTILVDKPATAPGPTQLSVVGQKAPVEVFDLRVRTTKPIMELRVEPVPGEECLVDNDCVSIDLDEADFVCHRTRKSYTALVLEGYDAEQLDQVGLGEDYQWNDERTNRLFYEDEDPDAEDEDDPSMRTYWVHECHAWFDYDGDGIAEHRRVTLIGDRVFDNEETNYQPMVALSSILMQHKHNGMAYIDIVKDLQILLSTLTRQLLDNIYKINVRRKVFSEDALTEDGATMEAILNTQAEFIPVRGPAQNAFVPEPQQSIVQELLPVIQYFDERVNVRSGVSQHTGVDPNVLQEVTATAFMGMMEQASQRIEMLTRIYAETGVTFLMQKIHQLVRSHWDIAKTVRIRGEWVPVDPQGWRERTDMTVNVGLGFNNKQQQLQLLMSLLSMQKEAVAAGLSTPEKIYNALEKMVNASGLGDVRQYFVDPKSPEYEEPQPQPDPQAILAEAQAKAVQQEQERKMMEAQMKGQHDQQKLAQDHQLAMGKQQLDEQSKQLDMRRMDTENAAQAREMSDKEVTSDHERDNIDADTNLKYAQAKKADVDASASAVEASDTFREAKRIIEDDDEDGDESDDDTETEE